MKNILLILILFILTSTSTKRINNKYDGKDTIRFNHVVEVIGEQKRDWEEIGYFVFTNDSIHFQSFWSYKVSYLKDNESRYYWRLHKSIWWCQISDKEIVVRSGDYPYAKMHYIKE